MPNSLVAEGMAQCGGLLVSEVYKFSELVVLAKFAKCDFRRRSPAGRHAPLPRRHRTGQGLSAHRVTVTAHVGEPAILPRPKFSSPATRRRCRPNKPKAACCSTQPHLLHWLRLVGVFDVGVRPDGTRLRAEDYNFH